MQIAYVNVFVSDLKRSLEFFESTLGLAPPQRQSWGGFIALLADPDGNLFYLDQIDAAHA